MELNDEIQGLIELVSNVLDAHTSSLFIPRKGETKLKLCAHYSLSHFILPGVEIEFGSGLVGWVARQSEPVNYSNFEHDPKTLQYYTREENIKSFMAVPVTGEARLLGVLSVDSKRSHVFNPKQQKILSGFAQQLAGILIRQEQTGDTLAKAAGYSRMLGLMEGFRDSEGSGLAELTLQASQKIIGFKSCLLALANQSETKLQVKLAYGYTPAAQNNGPADPDIGLARVIWHKRVPLVLNNLRGKPQTLPVLDNLYPQTQVRGFLGLPLCFAGITLGLLAYTSDQEQIYSRRDMEVAGILAWQVAGCAYKTMSQAERQTQVCRDSLTQTLTHTAFRSEMNTALEQANRYNPLSLLRLEVVNLEAVNARYGCQAGDSLLARIAKILRDMNFEVIGRPGGNQFAVFLPDTNREKAQQSAKRIQQVIGRVNFEFGEQPVSGQAVNIGLACYPGDTKDKSKLWELAAPKLS